MLRSSRMRRISWPSPCDLGVVEAAGRLVEQQQLRPRRERARQLDALLQRRTADRRRGDARRRRDRGSRSAPRRCRRASCSSRRVQGRCSALLRRSRCGRADGRRPAHCRAPTWCGTARGSGRCGRCRSRRCDAAGARGCSCPRTGCRRRPACRGGEKQLNSVVLPAPFGPIRPSRLPLGDGERHAVERHDAAEAHAHLAHGDQRRASWRERLRRALP